MSETIRLAAVGLGRHMREVLLPALTRGLPYELVAACDADREKLASFRRIFNVAGGYTDYRDMFGTAPADAVLIAVGHDSNGPIIAEALRHGVHVFVEKTPVRSVQEADELAALARSMDRAVMVGFNRRFMDPYAQARSLAAAPEFGGVRLFQSQFHAGWYGEDAFIVNHIIHHLDLARFLLGEVDITHAQRVQVGERMYGYTISLASRGSADGARAIGTIQAGSLLDARYPVERLELVGAGGNIVVDNLGDVVYHPPTTWNGIPLGAVATPPGAEWAPSPHRPPHRNLAGYEKELAEFLAAVRTGQRPSPDLADARCTLALIDQLYARLQLGGKAKMPGQPDSAHPGILADGSGQPAVSTSRSSIFESSRLMPKPGPCGSKNEPFTGVSVAASK
jgi:predicted dehydrogenase